MRICNPNFNEIAQISRFVTFFMESQFSFSIIQDGKLCIHSGFSAALFFPTSVRDFMEILNSNLFSFHGLGLA